MMKELACFKMRSGGHCHKSKLPGLALTGKSRQSTGYLTTSTVVRLSVNSSRRITVLNRITTAGGLNNRSRFSRGRFSAGGGFGLLPVCGR